MLLFLLVFCMLVIFLFFICFEDIKRVVGVADVWTNAVFALGERFLFQKTIVIVDVEVDVF